MYRIPARGENGFPDGGYLAPIHTILKNIENKKDKVAFAALQEQCKVYYTGPQNYIDDIVVFVNVQYNLTQKTSTRKRI